MYYLGESLTWSPHALPRHWRQGDLTSFLLWDLGASVGYLGKLQLVSRLGDVDLGNQRVRALKDDLTSIGDLVEETLFQCCLSNYLTCENSHVGLEETEIHRLSGILLTLFF